MKVTQSRLQQIILEEYIKEEALEEALSPQQEKEMLAWIRKQGPKPDWLGDNYGHSKKVKSGQVPADPNADRAAQTMPIGMDIPSDDAPERDYSGFQDRAGPDDTPSSEVNPVKATVDGIYELVSDMDPEDVREIFQIVFEKLPGVEMGMADDEEELGTPYGGKEFDRRKGQFGQAGFREQLVNNIYGVLLELDGIGSWGMKSMAGITGKRDEDEVDEGLDDYPDFEPAYDVMKGEGPPEEAPFHDVDDPHAWTDDDLDELSDEELIDFADRDGIETFRYRDRIEGTPYAHSMELSPKQRTALIDAIKNV